VEVQGVQFAGSEPPRGIYPTRVDEKGRLKLPADFHKYFAESGATKVFVTSFDGHIARIYPIPVWKQVEKLLREGGDDSEAAEDLWFTAMDFGADAEADAQGRLLMPSNLRREMGVENQQVYLEYYRGHVNVFGTSVYEERRKRAAENRNDKLKAFEKRGML
jgi:MraZ protein